jgi:lactate dehydrogenase-like 2-hydroxyacid dehydrogenase
MRGGAQSRVADNLSASRKIVHGYESTMKPETNFADGHSFRSASPAIQVPIDKSLERTRSPLLVECVLHVVNGTDSPDLPYRRTLNIERALRIAPETN